MYEAEDDPWCAPLLSFGPSSSLYLVSEFVVRAMSAGVFGHLPTFKMREEAERKFVGVLEPIPLLCMWFCVSLRLLKEDMQFEFFFVLWTTEFDVNRDGRLNRQEYEDLFKAFMIEQMEQVLISEAATKV